MSKSTGARTRGSPGRGGRGVRTRGGRTGWGGQAELAAMDGKPRFQVVQIDTLPRVEPIEKPLTPPRKRSRRQLWKQEREISKLSNSTPPSTSVKQSPSMSETSLSKDDSTISTPRSSKKRSWNMNVRFSDDNEEQQSDHSEPSVWEPKPGFLFAEAVDGPSISLADPLLAIKPETLRPSSPEIVMIEAEDYRPSTSMQSSLDVTDDTIPSSSADRPSSVITCTSLSELQVPRTARRKRISFARIPVDPSIQLLWPSENQPPKEANPPSPAEDPSITLKPSPSERRNERIADYFNFGSEEESSDDDDGAFVTFTVPRADRIWIEDVEVNGEVDAQVTYQWPPPPAHLPESQSPPPSPESPVLLLFPEALAAAAVDCSMVPGPSNKFTFDWRAISQPQVHPELRRETFSDIKCGPTAVYGTPYEAFTAIWSPEIMAVIVKETNRYAQQLTAVMIADGSLRPNSRINNWKDTDADEMLVYFAITLAMGVVVKTRVEEYWSKSNELFSTPGFSAAMSVNRYLLLGKCLHFNNNEEFDPTLSRAQAKIFKIKPIVDHLNEKFSILYRLGQNIALDESLMQWKGWLDINQFIKDKVAGVGIKTYEICESATGYLWRFQIHAGHDHKPEDSGPISGTLPALVLRLLQGLEHKGHTVFMDNLYNSPALARELKTRGFDCVGTLRLNRQLVPPEISQLNKQNMTLGQVCGCTSGDVDIVVWKDKNLVTLLSTYHGLATVKSNGTLKPSVIPDYNICMGGIDRKDQMLSMYPIERRRTKVWYKKLFRRLLNCSVLNAYIMKKNRQATLTHRNFRTALILDLIVRHKPPSVVRSLPVGPYLGHFPAVNEMINSYVAKKLEKKRRKCVHCSKRTTSYCPSCNVALCTYTCFQPYHQQRLEGKAEIRSWRRIPMSGL